MSPSASYLLTYLAAEPPNPGLAIGTTTELPPTPRSFSENGRFLGILNEVLAENAQLDEDLRAAAQAFAGPGGVNLGGGMMRGRGKRRGGSDGAGGASDQGGAGGGGAGGWVHLSDVSSSFPACLVLSLSLLFGEVYIYVIADTLACRGETRQILGG